MYRKKNSNPISLFCIVLLYFGKVLSKILTNVSVGILKFSLYFIFSSFNSLSKDSFSYLN